MPLATTVCVVFAAALVWGLEARHIGKSRVRHVTKTVDVARAAAERTEAWDYSHQANWPGICDARFTHRQSPISFANASAFTSSIAGDYDVQFVGPCVLSAKAKGVFDTNLHQFVVTDPRLACSVKDPLTGRRYKVLALHFHLPAEHVLPDGPADMEVHIVSNSTTPGADEKLVVATLFRKSDGEDQPGTTSTLADMFRGKAGHAGGASYVVDLLPSRYNSFYYYDGSLTTPPCTENVHWVVFPKAVPVPPKILRDLQKVMQQDKTGPPFTNNRDARPATSRHHVRLVTSGDLLSWALSGNGHARKVILVLAGVMVIGGIVLLLHFRQDTDESTYESIPDKAPRTEMVEVRQDRQADHAAVPVEERGDPLRAEGRGDSGRTVHTKTKHVSYGTL